MSRGPHPEDSRLFGAEQLAVLRRAAEEVSWLLGRGYSIATAIAAAGNHHQLAQRQRVALARGCASDAAREARLARLRACADARDQRLSIDGFNLLISLEVALSAGVLVRGRDTVLRDLAGLRGSYRTIEESARAIDLVGAQLSAHAPAHLEWLLDRAVSNAGRLKTLIRERARSWPFTVEVTLVPDPDPLLSARDWVVSGDAVVLDRCGLWINLASEIVAAHAPSAWIIDLSAAPTGVVFTIPQGPRTDPTS